MYALYIDQNAGAVVDVETLFFAIVDLQASYERQKFTITNMKFQICL